MRRTLLLAVAVAALGCPSIESYDLDEEALLNPASCAGCHPDHFEQWSGSMHAYTGFDPVFDASNRVYLQDTGDARPDHCVRCHSPMAVREGFTENGLDLADAPDHLRGITCATCHLIEALAPDHTGDQEFARDGVLRGGLVDPSPTSAHASRYSLLHDRNDPSSSDMCGSCHCVWNQDDLHVERTLHEWRGSVYANHDLTRQTCGGCHMRGRDGRAATDPGLPIRRLHDHTFPGVDTALTDFPGKAAQAAAIQDELDNSLLARLCVEPDPAGAAVSVRLENIGAGHSFPSGASIDRRVWVEVRAWVGDTEVLTSGVVADGQPVTDLVDPTLWLMRDRDTGPDGEEVLFNWLATEVDSRLLTAATTVDPTDPDFLHSQERRWPVYAGIPDRVTMRVRMRALGLDVFEALVEQGGLDPALAAEQPTWDLRSTELEWTGGLAQLGTCVPAR